MQHHPVCSHRGKSKCALGREKQTWSELTSLAETDLRTDAAFTQLLKPTCTTASRLPSLVGVHALLLHLPLPCLLAAVRTCGVTSSSSRARMSAIRDAQSGRHSRIKRMTHSKACPDYSETHTHTQYTLHTVTLTLTNHTHYTHLARCTSSSFTPVLLAQRHTHTHTKKRLT